MEGQAARKYTTEWTLVLTVNTVVLGRQQDLAQATLPDKPACHLYLVTRRPRVSIVPDTVVFSNEQVSGTVRLQRGGEYEQFEFTSSHPFGAGSSWHSEWPYEEFHIKDSGDAVVLKGTDALLDRMIDDGWPRDARLHEVVYVGQAYGQDGERTAWDRLKRHETVQRILAETPPDQQVWLSLAAITDVNLASEILPNVPTLKSASEDSEHSVAIMRAIRDGQFVDKTAVALAEAGLIRYFQPKYNDRLKYNFPDRKQVPLDAARALDLHGLVVELNGEGVGGVYGSPRVSQKLLHFAGFEVHLDDSRAITLALQSVDLLIKGD